MAWNNSIKQRGKTLEEKFWEKVDIRGEDECWEWKACTTIKGYGSFYVSTGHSRCRNHSASRMSWILTNGSIESPRIEVCHKCDNPSCVNPKHLFLGTHQDNIDDMVRKGRRFNGIGEDAPNAKLTEDDVRCMKKMKRTSKISYAELGRRFHVDISTARYICIGKLWKHIP